MNRIISDDLSILSHILKLKRYNIKGCRIWIAKQMHKYAVYIVSFDRNY